MSLHILYNVCTYLGDLKLIPIIRHNVFLYFFRIFYSKFFKKFFIQKNNHFYTCMSKKRRRMPSCFSNTSNFQRWDSSNASFANMGPNIYNCSRSRSTLSKGLLKISFKILPDPSLWCLNSLKLTSTYSIQVFFDFLQKKFGVHFSRKLCLLTFCLLSY